jgi:polyhydroxyalkanoate synthesis regulator protein
LVFQVEIGGPRRFPRADGLRTGIAGRYLTLEDVRQWVKEGVSFRIEDSETGEDITRMVLA